MRPVGVAHDLAEIEPHVVRNFTPALPRFELRYDVIEALARGLGQQVCILQVAIAEPRRRLLRLKRAHGNTCPAGNPSQNVRAARCIGMVCLPCFFASSFPFSVVRLGIDHFFFLAGMEKTRVVTIRFAGGSVACCRSAVCAPLDSGIIFRSKSRTTLSRLSSRAARGCLTKLASLHAGIIL
jgi:hypothetical protein